MCGVLLAVGATLKSRGAGSYQIDLTERDSHKTVAIFGPSRTTCPPTVARRIHQLITLDGLQAGDYLFHHSDVRGSELHPTQWTRFVQSTFKTYSGVGLSPKDCRSSFITFLRDGNHGDETLRAAALAMRHSSKMAQSAHYDKHGSDRLVAAAVSAAQSFANQFQLAHQ